VLPVAERELRVAARKRSTFWIRIVAALLALGVTGLLLLIFHESQSRVSIPNKGRMLFSVLAWLAYIYAFAAGVFLTSDCLSEEKRDGTLGLLFLTDLRGYDVVLGKLAATSLHALYGLVAVFPVIAISLLLGGLLAEQFWKSILAIANTLFFSLALGIAASCVSREALRAMNAALLLLALFVGVPYLIDFAIAGWKLRNFVAHASLVTPLHSFLAGGGLKRWPYWSSLLLSHVIGWLCLAVTAWIVPRSWQERRIDQGGNVSRRRRVCAQKEAGERSADPILWLAGRARRFRLWLLVVVLGATLFAGLAADFPGGWLTVIQMVLNLFGILLYLWMAAHASRFFVEGVKSGAFELIVCTPITSHDVLRAQRRSFLRTFTLPLLLLLTAEQLVALIQWANALVVGGMSGYMIANQISAAVNSATTAIAIGWFAMWSGLRSRKTHVAVIKTLVFVFVLPLIAAGVIETILSLRLLFGVNIQWVGPIVTGLLLVAKDAAFILWSRHRLYTRFQETIAGGEPAGRLRLDSLQEVPRPIANLRAPPEPLLRG